MNKWALLCAAASVAAVGCGGNGGGPGVGVPGTGTDSIASVSLPDSPGQVNVAVLTGQGRAQGDVTAVMRRLVLEDEFGAVETILNPERTLHLGGYTHQILALNVPTTVSRLMTVFHLEVLELRVDNGFGGFNVFRGPGGQAAVLDQFPARIRVFPGRHSSVQIFLDDAMVNVENNQPVFDRELFELRNLDEDDDIIPGFIGDYVRFDISNLAQRPPMPTAGLASHVYFSGDAIALSDAGPTGAFHVLTPLGFREGRFGPPGQLGGALSPGTYSLIEPDPRDLTEMARITSLQGIWRDVTNVVANLGTFEVITLPTSADDEVQELVMFARNGAGQISQMYFGEVNLTSGTFSAFPIDQVTSGSADNEITGTLTNLRNGAGAAVSDPRLVRQGRYSIAGSVPAGFRADGRFIVFRR